MLVPVRQLGVKVQVPVALGVKRTIHLLPAVALVLAALPSAAQYPGTVKGTPLGVVKVTSRR